MDTAVGKVLHITTPEEWEATRQAGGLSAEPFLHLCTAAQLPFVLQKHFAGRHGLVLVHLDPAGLDVRWERSEPGHDPFPHLYGWAPVSAAAQVTKLPDVSA
jgi:uncharacterized protein (DUF952 family)